MKQILERKEIEVLTWIPTEKQLADAMTKASAVKTPLSYTLQKGQFYN